MKPLSGLVALLAAACVQSTVADAAVTRTRAGPVNAVSVARGDTATVTSSLTAVDLPGASVGIVVPAGKRALLVARFTAESQCSPAAGVTGADWCNVQIVGV